MSDMVKYFLFFINLCLSIVHLIVFLLSHCVFYQRFIVTNFWSICHPSDFGMSLYLGLIFQNLIVSWNANEFEYFLRNKRLSGRSLKFIRHMRHLFLVANNVNPSKFRIINQWNDMFCCQWRHIRLFNEMAFRKQWKNMSNLFRKETLTILSILHTFLIKYHMCQ